MISRRTSRRPWRGRRSAARARGPCARLEDRGERTPAADERCQARHLHHGRSKKYRSRRASLRKSHGARAARAPLRRRQPKESALWSRLRAAGHKRSKPNTRKNTSKANCCREQRCGARAPGLCDARSVLLGFRRAHGFLRSSAPSLDGARTPAASSGRPAPAR